MKCVIEENPQGVDLGLDASHHGKHSRMSQIRLKCLKVSFLQKILQGFLVFYFKTGKTVAQVFVYNACLLCSRGEEHTDEECEKTEDAPERERQFEK